MFETPVGGSRTQQQQQQQQQQEEEEEEDEQREKTKEQQQKHRNQSCDVVVTGFEETLLHVNQGKCWWWYCSKVCCEQPTHPARPAAFVTYYTGVQAGPQQNMCWALCSAQRLPCPLARPGLLKLDMLWTLAGILTEV